MNETEYIKCREKQAEELTALFYQSMAEHEIVKNRIVFSAFDSGNAAAGGYAYLSAFYRL